MYMVQCFKIVLEKFYSWPLIYLRDVIFCLVHTPTSTLQTSVLLEFPLNGSPQMELSDEEAQL
jgi:hypothetical protein